MKVMWGMRIEFIRYLIFFFVLKDRNGIMVKIRLIFVN